MVVLSCIGNGCITALPTKSASNRDLIKDVQLATNACLINHLNAALPTHQVEIHRTLVSDQLKKQLKLIGTSMMSRQYFLCQLTTMQATSSDKSSKSFKKLPPKYQNMMLVAARKGEVMEVELNDQASAFFKCSIFLNANIILNSFFEAEIVECSVSNAATAALTRSSFYGKIL